MNCVSAVIFFVAVWLMTVDEVHGQCPHPDYIKKHVCEGCSYKKAKDKALKSNEFRKWKTCIVTVFKGSTKRKDFYVKGDRCIQRWFVDAWHCYNLLKNSGAGAKCSRLIWCHPVHSTQNGHLENPRCEGKPWNIITPQNSEKCVKTCQGVTATSRGVCRVGSAVAAGAACLATAWFTLGFSCVGAIGLATTFSTGCATVTNMAEEGCGELCTSILKNIDVNEATDYNKLLNDHICVLEETKSNYQWLEAVEFQGGVVKRQKEILDKLDSKKGALSENRLREFFEFNLLNDIRNIRESYDKITYSVEGLLTINSETDEFKLEALQEHKLQKILRSLYRHLSGMELPSIYKQQSDKFCNVETFDLMNSYLAEGHIMLFIAMELDNTHGYIPELTEYLDGHLTEYKKQCGCPSGKHLHIVQAKMDSLIKRLQGVEDIFSGPDLLLAANQFTQENIDLHLDVDIVVKALAGTVLANSNDGKAVIESLETIKYKISKKSLKICTGTLTACAKQPRCTIFRGSCWCLTNFNQPSYEACGYKKGYSGEYYSIVSSCFPYDLIVAMGLKPAECRDNNHCSPDCATNKCYLGLYCWGTNLECWDDTRRWNYREPKGKTIVRCKNFEH